MSLILSIDAALSEQFEVGGAVGFSLATGAVGADPELIELLHDGANESSVAGEDATLEVATVLALHTEAGSGEIGAARVGYLPVDDHAFEVNPGAEDHLHAVDEIWEAIVVGTKGGAGFFGMY